MIPQFFSRSVPGLSPIQGPGFDSYLLKSWIILLFLGIGSKSYGQQAPPPKVLFVGNSYTYFWNLPQSVMALAKHKQIELDISQSTSGGANLGHHWRGERGLTTVSKLKANAYDQVILQDHSRGGIDHPDSMLHYGQLLNGLIKQSGAQAYLYLTWAREWDPYMQAGITEAYRNLAKKIDAKIVPVGLAWQRARTLRPDLSLYDEDGSHPSPTGTYLSACVFYGVLTEQSPIGLPNRIVWEREDGEKLYLNIQSKETALFCQKVAKEIISQVAD